MTEEKAHDVWLPLRRKDGTVRAWAVIDVADAPAVAGYRWSLSGRGYVVRTIRFGSRRDGTRGSKTVRLSRVLLGLTDPAILADHKDGDPLNNRRENLRAVSPSGNSQNRHYGYGSSSHRGVSYFARTGRWRVTVGVPGKGNIHGGYYDDELEAARVAEALRREHQPASLC